jgi:hypothetical protein
MKRMQALLVETLMEMNTIERERRVKSEERRLSKNIKSPQTRITKWPKLMAG